MRWLCLGTEMHDLRLTLPHLQPANVPADGTMSTRSGDKEVEKRAYRYGRCLDERSLAPYGNEGQIAGREHLDCAL